MYYYCSRKLVHQVVPQLLDYHHGEYALSSKHCVNTLFAINNIELALIKESLNTCEASIPPHHL